MEKIRRQFSPQQKVAILREHLVEHVPVSDLCDKHKLHPTLFFQWQKAFLRTEPRPLKVGGAVPVFIQGRG